MTYRTVTFASIAAAGLLSVAAGLSYAGAEDKIYSDVLEPGLGKSFVVGDKKAVTYFEKTDGACDLTIVVGELDPMKGGKYSYSSRVKVSVAPGRSTNFDSAEGQSISFTCNDNAVSMGIDKGFIGPVPVARRS